MNLLGLLYQTRRVGSVGTTLPLAALVLLKTKLRGGLIGSVAAATILFEFVGNLGVARRGPLLHFSYMRVAKLC